MFSTTIYDLSLLCFPGTVLIFSFLFFSEINHDHHMCCSITRCHCNYFGYHSELMLHVIWTNTKKNSAHKRWCGHFYSNGDQYRIVRRIYCMTFQWLVYQITCTEQWYPPHNMLIKKKKVPTKKNELVKLCSEQRSKAVLNGFHQLNNCVVILLLKQNKTRTAPSRCLILFFCRIETLTQELVP